MRLRAFGTWNFNELFSILEIQQQSEGSVGPINLVFFNYSELMGEGLYVRKFDFISGSEPGTDLCEKILQKILFT